MKLSAGGAGVTRALNALRLLADTISLQGLVDDLLFRARSESGSLSRPSAPIDLDDLVLEEAPRLAERGRVQVDVRAVSAARVLGDAEQLARTSRNLTSNTERHATRTVTLELRENAEYSVLVVADYGPGHTCPAPRDGRQALHMA